MTQINLTPVALIVFSIAVVIAFLIGTHIDRQRLKRKETNKYPLAKKEKKYPMIVDAKLDQDITESFYHQ